MNSAYVALERARFLLADPTTPEEKAEAKAIVTACADDLRRKVCP
jgi:hypothetical protein